MIKMFKGIRRKRKMPRQDVKGRVILGTGFSSSGTSPRLGSGAARNLSASGISFETNEELLVGSTIAFTIALETSEGMTTMRCSGTVIRRDELDGGRVAFAVQFDEQKIET
jgi:hypothetical protein